MRPSAARIFSRCGRRVSELEIVFLVQDTAELNFTLHVQCEGLGPIGHGGQMRGLHQQNVLAVDPRTKRPIGLMYQRHHRRRSRPAGHDRAAGRRVSLEERESYWWIEAIRAIGPPPAGVRWVHVGDRGEDIFGAYDEARRWGADWLIRVARDRAVVTPRGPDSLFAYARRLPCVAHRCLTVRRKGSQSQEEVELPIATGDVMLQPSRYERGYRDRDPVECAVVRVGEALPPPETKPLEWLLCTSLPCQPLENLMFVAEGYSLRWLVEEFHKCEKTGCQVEMRRLEHVDRLEPLIGLLSILSVRLLGLKFAARDEPDRLAHTVFDHDTVAVMAQYLKQSPHKMTIHQFWQGIGRLGGHSGRKRDGPIGWLRAWRGWQSFQLILLGATLGKERPIRCG